MRKSSIATILLGSGIALVGAACNQPTYLADTRTLETMPAMGGGFATDTDTFTIPVRLPTAKEQADLVAEQTRLQLPNPPPWVAVRDLPVQLQYTVKNLEDHDVVVNLILGGGSEFGVYNPLDFYDPTDPEAIAPPPLAGATPIRLAAHESRELVFREDEIAEAAIDIEAIVRYQSMPFESTPFKVLSSRSDINTIGLEMIPPGNITPQQVTLTLNLIADGHVTCEYNVRVRDLKGRLAAPGAATYMPPPVNLRDGGTAITD